MRNALRNTVKFFGLVLFVSLAMVVSTCGSDAEAQEGVIPTPEQTIEERLSITGPITMDLVWDYIIAEFGEPLVKTEILVFDAGAYPDEGIFHLQSASADGEGFHMDIPLDVMAPGGAITNDEMFHFIWFCQIADIEDPLVGCTLPLAEWVVAYDVEGRAVLVWNERIQ